MYSYTFTSSSIPLTAIKNLLCFCLSHYFIRQISDHRQHTSETEMSYSISVCSGFFFLTFQRKTENIVTKQYEVNKVCTGLFISPSGTSELDCATTKKDRAERSISIGRESLKVFFCTRGLGVLAGSTARG